MSSLLPPPLGSGNRNNAEKRAYVLQHMADIDYRTKACADEDTASVEELKLRKAKEYYFPT